jgi:protein O-GlcNAc transferase
MNAYDNETLPDLLNSVQVAHRKGDRETVRRLCKEAPVLTDSHQWQPACSIAHLLFDLQCADVAERWYSAIAHFSSHAGVYAKLAEIHTLQGVLSKAKSCFRKALRLDPDNADYLANYGSLLLQMGRIGEGVAYAYEAQNEAPMDMAVQSSYLMSLHYQPVLDVEAIAKEHLKWGTRHGRSVTPLPQRTGAVDPEKKLRVGYLSADFRMHSVAYVMEGLFRACDRDGFEIVGYHCGQLTDHVTDYLRDLCDGFHLVAHLSDREIAHQVRADGIDILVLVAGHSYGNRLGVSLYRPAPIQVDFGSISTLGTEHIQYRLIDAILDPPESQAYYTETLVYLPGGYICYRPPTNAPEIAPLPARKNGYVTFGSFNGAQKINHRVIALWAQVLTRAKDARFLLKCPGADEVSLSEFYLRQFEAHGIARERIDIHGWKNPMAHLELYNQMDISLDTFPFNGCLTSLEGLWMGVPLISLRGAHHVSHMGLAILNVLEMPFFAAQTADEYVTKAALLAQDLTSLEKIRASLRHRMAASPLMDAQRFAREVEQAYCQMWHTWVNDRASRNDSGAPAPRCMESLHE